MIIDLDFETRSELDVTEVGAWRYAEHESTEPLLLTYYIRGAKHVWRLGDKTPKRLYTEIRKGAHVRAHNSFFEWCIFSLSCTKLGWPDIPLEIVHCTQVQGFCNTLMPSLDDAAKILKLEQRKDPEGKRLINFFCGRTRQGYWNEPHLNPVEFKEFEKYNDDDVLTQIGIAEAIPPLSKFQRDVHLMTERMNRRGMPIDIPMCRGAVKLAETYLANATIECAELTHGVITNPRGRKGVLEWYEENGCPIPNLQKETIERALLRENTPTVQRMLEIRQKTAKSSTAKYQKAIDTVGTDARCHGTLQAFVARTGRWGGRLIQPHNLFRSTLEKWVDFEYIAQLIQDGDLDAINMLYGDVMDVLASATRSMIAAPKGKRFIVADYAQIEARLLFWVANQLDALQAFIDGEDIYKLLAVDIYSKPLDIISVDERFVGKQAILGLGYGMGVAKFVIQMIKFGMPMPEKFLKKVIDLYRKKYRRVVKLWEHSETAARKAIQHPKETFSVKNAGCKITYRMVKGDLVCKLPSGRDMYYKGARVDYKEKFGREQPCITYMGFKSEINKWVRMDTYGGKLVENFIQAIATDIMAHGMLEAEKEGYDQIFTVHDEAIAEMADGVGSVKEYEDILCRLPNWAKGCPIVAEGWEGTRYKKA